MKKDLVYDQEYLYHCTSLAFLDDILRYGLIAQIPDARKNKPKGIYLSDFKFNWMWYAQRSGYRKGAVLKIKVKGFPLIKDFHEDPRDVKLNSKNRGNDFICLCNIPPHRIIEVEIEKDPNCFHRLHFDIMKIT